MQAQTIQRRKNLRSARRIPKISPISIASLLFLATIFAFFEQGFVTAMAFLVGATMLTLSLLIFYIIFAFRLNTRFFEPSLTLAQITVSVIIMLTVFFLDRAVQLALGPFLLVAFSYGVFRLTKTAQNALAAGTMLTYLAIVLGRGYQEEFSGTFRLDLLLWIVIALTLPMTMTVSAQIRQLRSALKNTRQQLLQFEEKAIRDELTGLYNRRQLQTELDLAIAQSSEHDTPFCLCLIDVDHFKDINDKHGHLAGDMILREFARVARESIRDSDIIGRYGGDEFMQILPDTELKGAVMHAERLRVHAHFLDLKSVLPQKSISLSIGVAQYRPGEEVAELIERADAALYRAKERGRNRVEWIDGD
jgi:diguanylate cyclase (GGDEF)-like protein